MFRRRSTFPYWLELLARAAASALYRVRPVGAANVPSRGGAVLIANHLSYADVVLLQLACPRPLRFVGYEGPESPWFFRAVFRLAGVIPISPANPTPGFRQALRALAAGEVVAVFPEGQISRLGQLLELKRGFAILARRARVPVVPAAIDGLWGSVFSFSGDKYLWKSPRLMPTPVAVAFGPPISPESATPEEARRALLGLGADALGERPVLCRHLCREVVRSLARRPGRVAIVDRSGDRRVLSRGRLLAVSAALSRRIASTVPEERVGIVLPPGAGAAIANLAVACAGKVPVNLNFTAGRSAAEASLRQAGIRTVLTAAAMREKFPAFPWPEATVDLREEIAAAGGARAILPWLLAAWVLPNQWIPEVLGLPRRGGAAEASLVFTSGSSGEPRGVVLTHRNLLANCGQFASLSACPPKSVMLGCLPLFHSFGATVTLWYPLLRGNILVTVPSALDTRGLVDAIAAEGATVLVGAPTFLRPFLKKARAEELRSLRRVVAGAERLPEDLAAGFREQFGLDILEGYGLTEASPVVSVNQPDPPVATATAEPQAGRRPGTVGRLLPGLAARIVDPESGADLPLTQTGVLWLRGENVFAGYLGDPERTAAVLGPGGWLATGDLARFDADGFLTIAGRLSRFSKIAGEMVPHGEVERRVVELFGLDQSEGPAVAVVGLPDPARGEALVLLSTSALPADRLRAGLAAAGLPNLWVPKVVRRVERIPVLGSGKTDLLRCRQIAREMSERESP
jgi:acyl-[acyl-carrier-protein]-phospholipid O-acyltransferase/long-chain-fatty-acid--[acyl-carrier-protein] ligase